MTRLPDLSIIVINWNTADLLRVCLQSVQQDSATDGCILAETIVVDNASRDDSSEMVRAQFPNVTLVVNDQNIGFARANNQALQISRGRYCLLLNSDTVLHPGALKALVDFADAHPTAGAVGARLLNGDGSLQPSVHPMLTPGRELWRLLFLDRIINLASYRQAHWSVTEPRQVESIKGACLLLRRNALEQTGLLDDRYFMYTEEVDLCYRLAQAGWELWYVPTAVVTHFGEASSKQVADVMYLQLYRSKIQFYRKFGGRMRAYVAKFVLLIAYVPRAVVGSLVALFKPDWRPLARTWRKLVFALPGM